MKAFRMEHKTGRHKPAKLYTFDGEKLTPKQISVRMQCSVDTARRYCGDYGATNAAEFAAVRREMIKRQHAGTRMGGKRSSHSSMLPGEFRK